MTDLLEVTLVVDRSIALGLRMALTNFENHPFDQAVSKTID